MTTERCGPVAGLCERCRHARRVTSGRGSTFLLCRRAEREPAYARYPALPVLECRGYERDAESEPAAG